MTQDFSNRQFLLGESLSGLPEEILSLGFLHSWKESSLVTPSHGSVDGLYYVKEGAIRVLRPNADGMRRTLFIVNAGHFFFEAHFFRSPMLFTEAEAVCAAKVVFFERQVADSLLESNARFRKQLMHSLSCKAIVMGAALVADAYSPPQQRLMQALENMAVSSCPLDGKGSNGRYVDMTQDELAELVGLHRTSVNRGLRKLEQDGMIRIQRGRITLLWEDLGINPMKTEV